MRFLALSALLFACGASIASAQTVRIITREAQREGAQLIEITDESLTIRTERGGLETIALDDCIGLVNTTIAVQPRGSSAYAPQGMLALTDGQQLPGSPMLGPEAGDDVLSWRNRLLGRVGIPLERLAWAGFRITAEPPEAGAADVIVLVNNDRVEGFITALRDPVEIEQHGRMTTIALDSISAIRLVSPAAAPAPGAKRIWFEDGTVLDVPALSLGDDGYLRFAPPLGEALEGELDTLFSRVAGILFDIDALVPFASLAAQDLEGPVTRYEVPAPEVDPSARALGLRDVTLRGPLTARYALPPGARRFMGSARLLPGADGWSDCDVVISLDGRELFRQRLSSARRRINFDVPLDGAELAIEITEGGWGPVGDHVIFEGAMLTIDDD